MDKQEPVDCIHPREIMQYTGDGDEVAFCPECGQNRLTGHSRANRPADDGLVERLTRPIIGIENRTPQEAFDIMCDRILTTLRAQSDAEVERKFRLGDRVSKRKGSNWTGRVVGFYSTGLTPIGYAVESETERGSVQIYPEAALERGEHRKDGV